MTTKPFAFFHLTVFTFFFSMRLCRAPCEPEIDTLSSTHLILLRLFLLIINISILPSPLTILSLYKLNKFDENNVLLSYLFLHSCDLISTCSRFRSLQMLQINLISSNKSSSARTSNCYFVLCSSNILHNQVNIVIDFSHLYS